MKTMNKTRQQLSEMFVAALKEDKLPWRAVWHTGLPMNPTTGARYQGVNKLLLSMVSLQRGYSDPRWCTFLQAKNHGWSIRKGAKGVQVEYWAFVDAALAADGNSGLTIRADAALIQQAEADFEFEP